MKYGDSEDDCSDGHVVLKFEDCNISNWLICGFFLYLIVHAHYSLSVISCAELAAGIRS